MTLHTFQENSWTDDLVLLEWIFTVWCSIAAMTPRVKLLILDSYPLHKEVHLLSEFDTHVLYGQFSLWMLVFLRPLKTNFGKSGLAIKKLLLLLKLRKGKP